MTTSIKERFAARTGEGADRGDLVQTVLLIAGFAIVAILIVTWLGTAILNKGSDAASCIQNSSMQGTVSSTSPNGGGWDGRSPVTTTTNADAGCNENAASTHSYQSDSGYQSRYN